MKTKSAAPTALLVLAAVVVVLGFAQLYLVVAPQLVMIENAKAEGYAPEDISGYFWQETMPSVFSVVVPMVGFASALCGLGFLLRGQERGFRALNNPGTQNPPAGDDETANRTDAVKDALASRDTPDPGSTNNNE